MRVNDTGDLITEAERNATTITNVLSKCTSCGIIIIILFQSRSSC